MKRPAPQHEHERDRAGPLILLALIAAAFIPAVCMELGPTILDGLADTASMAPRLPAG